jgi:hypothetical protein
VKNPMSGMYVLVATLVAIEASGLNRPRDSTATPGWTGIRPEAVPMHASVRVEQAVMPTRSGGESVTHFTAAFCMSRRPLDRRAERSIVIGWILSQA